MELIEAMKYGTALAERATAQTMPALGPDYENVAAARAVAEAVSGGRLWRVPFEESEQLGRPTRLVFTLAGITSAVDPDDRVARCAVHLEVPTLLADGSTGIWTPKVGAAVFTYGTGQILLPGVRAELDPAAAFWPKSVSFTTTGLLEALVGQDASPLYEGALSGNGLAVPDVAMARAVLIVPARHSTDNGNDGPLSLDLLAQRWR
jgi:hypothetical protein